MALYLLERKPKLVGYDEFDAKLIRARSEIQARKIANENTGDEGKVWHQKGIKCTRVFVSGKEKEIIASFNAG